MAMGPRVLALGVCCFALALIGRPSATATQGLRGEYFENRAGYSHDEYRVPIASGKPATTRVDARLAFGRGISFGLESHWKQTRDGVAWWPGNAGAAFWKGYLRLPKPGTYHVATVSVGPSAVYLNGARVALNGTYGGPIRSAEFTYDDPDLPQRYPRDSAYYAMPVMVSAPAVLPIEVRLSLADHSSAPRGIDLYWTTPDSQRDAQGRAIATIVPTEALFVDAPEPVKPSVVSSLHSTISSDFLYLPPGEDQMATITVRVADDRGMPLAGRHVRIASLQPRGSSDGDVIVQPTAPTDARGVATARITLTAAHTSQVFANVIDDPASVGQVVEIVGLGSSQLSFLPQTYSPYYGGDKFKVSPLPMRVGQPVQLRVPLKSRRKQPYEVHVRAFANPPNIGLANWTQVGRTERFVIQPGESREVTITWTPTKEAGHLCFKIEIWGKPVRAQAQVEPKFQVIRAAFAQQPLIGPPDQGEQMLDNRQHNFGGVQPPGIDKAYWKGVRERAERVEELCRYVLLGAMGLEGWQRRREAKMVGKLALRLGKADVRLQGPFPRTKLPLGTPGIYLGTVCTVLEIVGKGSGEVADKYIEDPPDPDFESTYEAPDLAIELAKSDDELPADIARALTDYLSAELAATLRGYAALTSYERYLGAVEARDQQAAGRQYAAYLRYYSSLPAAFRRVAERLDALVPLLRNARGEQGKSPAPAAVEDSSAPSGSSQETRDLLRFLEFSNRFAESIVARSSQRSSNTSGDPIDQLAERARYFRRYGEVTTRNQLEGPFMLVNPHDRPEDIEVDIRRAALPPDWKLSLVNASGGQPVEIEETVPGQKYRVRLPAHGKAELVTKLHAESAITREGIASWAIEGRIRGELIGGIVQELNVPAVVATAIETQPSPGSWRTLILVAIVVLVGGTGGTLLVRRQARRPTATSSNR